jgi:hypothetical protein
LGFNLKVVWAKFLKISLPVMLQSKTANSKKRAIELKIVFAVSGGSMLLNFVCPLFTDFRTKLEWFLRLDR